MAFLRPSVIPAKPVPAKAGSRNPFDYLRHAVFNIRELHSADDPHMDVPTADTTHRVGSRKDSVATWRTYSSWKQGS